MPNRNRTSILVLEKLVHSLRYEIRLTKGSTMTASRIQDERLGMNSGGKIERWLRSYGMILLRHDDQHGALTLVAAFSIEPPKSLETSRDIIASNWRIRSFASGKVNAAVLGAGGNSNTVAREYLTFTSAGVESVRRETSAARDAEGSESCE